jgi:hypothetical protein
MEADFRACYSLFVANSAPPQQKHGQGQCPVMPLFHILLRPSLTLAFTGQGFFWGESGVGKE